MKLSKLPDNILDIQVNKKEGSCVPKPTRRLEITLERHALDNIAGTNTILAPAQMTFNGDQFSNWGFLRSERENYEMVTKLDEK